MGAVTNAFWRLLRAMGFRTAGQINEAADVIAQSPHAVRATFADIIEKKNQAIRDAVGAIAGRVSQQQQKMEQLKQLRADLEKQGSIKAGAVAMARNRMAALQALGKTEAEIAGDEQYKKCQSGFRDAASTFTEKEKRIVDLEQRIESDGKRISELKVQVLSMKTDLEKIREEEHDTVADLVMSKQELDQAAAEAGLKTDESQEDLRRMRELRGKAVSTARVMQEIAGTDVQRAQADFMAYAQDTAASDEFASLVGLKKTEAPVAAVQAPAVRDASQQLPE